MILMSRSQRLESDVLIPYLVSSASGESCEKGVPLVASDSLISSCPSDWFEVILER